jgi:hypothetical protein
MPEPQPSASSMVLHDVHVAQWPGCRRVPSVWEQKTMTPEQSILVYGWGDMKRLCHLVSHFTSLP